MDDYVPKYDDVPEPKFEGVNWNGLFLAPTLQVLLLMLPHLSNYIKERQLRSLLAATKSRKDELLRLKKELASISMTDEFARHAKLQRRINALQDDLTAETTEATNTAGAVKSKFHSACYGSLILSQLIMIMYHRSTPLFLFPAKWFGPVNWIISFPTGINGAVGFTFWLITCRRIINSIYNWIFPASKTDESSDQNMLSNLMNSMMGMKPGANPGFPGANPAFPRANPLFPGANSAFSGAFPPSGANPAFPGAFPPSGAFSGFPGRDLPGSALTPYGLDSRESSPESMEKMMVPALD